MLFSHPPLRHPKPDPGGNKPLQAWECHLCGGLHEAPAEARTCCAPQPALRWRCPVCKSVHGSHSHAAHCCEVPQP